MFIFVRKVYGRDLFVIGPNPKTMSRQTKVRPTISRHREQLWSMRKQLQNKKAEPLTAKGNWNTEWLIDTEEDRRADWSWQTKRWKNWWLSVYKQALWRTVRFWWDCNLITATLNALANCHLMYIKNSFRPPIWGKKNYITSTIVI